MNHIEMSGHTKDGITFVSARINAKHTGRFIEYLRTRVAKPFAVTLNAGVMDDNSPCDLIEIDSTASGVPNIDKIIASFPVL